LPLNPISTRTWRLAALGYLGVVIYLTLLPFDFSASISLADAWARYQTIRFDGSGPRARQQWASNVLMFVPLGFFWAAWFLHRVRAVWLQLAGAVLVMGFCLLVTATVEFFQIWIPNRGPSLSDMSANATGGVIGALGWLVSRIPTVRATARGLLHRRSGLATWVGVYLAAYVFASLLPLDFILSGRELAAKLSSGHWGWLTATGGCWWGIRCVVMRGLEIALAVPLGLWLAYRLRGSPARRLLLALAGGLLLGLVVELGQFMTVSGMAEGASVLLRALGAGLGAMFWLSRAQVPWQVIHRQSRLLLLMALPLYLLAVLLLSLAGARGLVTWHDAMAQLESLRWLPFYYHYFVPEALAIQSVLMHVGMYAFMGLGLWLWDLRARGGPRAVRAAWVAAAAVLLAVLVEGSKLWIAGLRPDTSTALLAALAAGGVYAAMWWWVIPGSVPREVSPEPGVLSVEDRPSGRSMTEISHGPPAWSRARWPLIILTALVCVWAVTWPAAGPWLGAGLAAYGVLLWRRPDAWALVLPALLPVLFLAPWSGRIFFDEFDLLLLVTVFLLLARCELPDHGVTLPRGFAWAVGLFALSMLLSLLPTLGSLFPLSPNSFVDYSSPWNGLRAVKGLAWALLLYLLLPRSGLPLDALLQRRFVPGMVLGLAGLALLLLWERATYPGLFNFSSSYRVTGLFAEMQVGGPSIEAYLLMAMPFLLIWAGQRARLWVWGFALAVLGAALYGLLMTYSRAGYLGLVLMVLLLVPGLWIHGTRHRGPGRVLWMVGAMVPVLLAVSLWSQVGGGFAGQRMQLVERDLVQRQALWSQALGFRDEGILARVLGQGPGSFPAYYQIRNPEARMPLNFAFLQAPDGEVFLRLGSGDSLYMNQRVGLERHQDYLVRVRARGEGGARLGLFVCEKHLKHSFQCRRASLQVAGEGAGWQTLEWRFNSGELGVGPWFARRGISFAVANLRDGTLVDVDALQLLDDQGRDHLRNGDFAAGADRWYYTSDSLDAFRVENQWLEVLFEQGWFGLLAFVALTLLAWLHLAWRALGGQLPALGVLAAMSGVLAVGVFSTVFWSPRVMLLFFLMLLLFMARGRDMHGVSGTRRYRSVQAPAQGFVREAIQPPPQPSPVVRERG